MNYGQLIRNYPNQIGYGMLHFFFSGLGQTYLISMFVAHFMASLSIDAMEFSWLYSGATLLSAFTLPFSGKYIDSIKVRYVSVSVAILLSIFSLVAASMEHIIVLGIALFGLRFCGQGMMVLVGSTATARYFSIARGKALSLVGLGISVGEFCLPFIVTYLLIAVGWRYTWLALSASVLILFIPAIIKLVPIRDHFQLPIAASESTKHSIPKGATRMEVLKDPKFYLLALLNLWVAFYITGVFIHQSTLANTYGWSLTLMASGISVFGLTRLISNLFLGPVIDTYTATKSFLFVLIPLMLGSLLLAFNQSAVSVILFFILCGISSSLSSITTTAMWAEVYGTAHLGAIRSTVSTFMVFSAAIAPVIVGMGFSQAAWISPTWITMTVLMGGSTLISFIVVNKLPLEKH